MNRVYGFAAASCYISVIAFAAADKGAGSSGQPAPIGTPVATPMPIATEPAPVVTPIADPVPTPVAVADAKSAKVKPEVTEIIADYPLPTRKNSGGRGGKTIYDFDKLEIGGSFGVKGKTVKGMASTVSSANERYRETVKDAAGNPIMIDDPKKPGAKIEAKNQTRKFICGAVDPADQRNAGATVRVWRVALDYVG